MGSGRFTDTDWGNYQSNIAGKTINQVFKQTGMKSTNDPRTSFDPKTIAVREARDSADHPASTPIIIAFDVTGSMGVIPHYFVKEGLGTLMKEIFDRKPVADPQIMCMAVGDARFDKAPLQVTQFEADIRIAEQLQDLYLEGGGGGNDAESYNLPWCFAAVKTSTDNYEKRGKKGLLFTIGDEPPLMELKAKHAEKFLGIDIGEDMTSEQMLKIVQRQYDVFHVVVEQGSGLTCYGEKAVIGGWNKLLGEGHVLRLADITKLAEVVTSAIQVNAGADAAAVAKSWSGDTSLVVAKAISKTVAATGTRNRKAHGPVRLGVPAPT